MNEMVSRLSSYNLFNYFFPGVLMVVGLEQFTPYSLPQSNLLFLAFICYFVGMVASRFGSVLIEPALKKVGFVAFCDYSEFVRACQRDTKIEILSEVNNTYRTLVAAVLLLVLAKGYSLLEVVWSGFVDLRLWLVALVVALLFLFSYRKQSHGIADRVSVKHKP